MCRRVSSARRAGFTPPWMDGGPPERRGEPRPTSLTGQIQPPPRLRDHPGLPRPDFRNVIPPGRGAGHGDLTGSPWRNRAMGKLCESRVG